MDWNNTYRRMDKLKATFDQLIEQNEKLAKKQRLRELEKEIRLLQAEITTQNEQTVARERVLETISNERDLLKKRLEELQALGDYSKDSRIDESLETPVVERT